MIYHTIVSCLVENNPSFKPLTLIWCQEGMVRFKCTLRFISASLIQQANGQHTDSRKENKALNKISCKTAFTRVPNLLRLPPSLANAGAASKNVTKPFGK